MSALEPLDLSLLSCVSGGAGEGPNQTVISGDIKVQTPIGVAASGQGTYQSTETDYARCIGLASKGGAAPSEWPAICGSPTGARPAGQ